MAALPTFIATARTDGQDRLIAAEAPLAELQLRCGGMVAGLVATPALLELVRESRVHGLRLTREIHAHDGRDAVTALVDVQPDPAGEGCLIGLVEWNAAPPANDAAAMAQERRIAIDRHVAELTARLDPDQRVIAVESESPELAEVAMDLRQGQGRAWTELVELADEARNHGQDWRRLNGTGIVIAGSRRSWKAVLVPLGRPDPGSAGFDLLFLADEPPTAGPVSNAPPGFSAAAARDIVPVLRQPVSRIIANADTIRTQLAGPLSEEYSKYADDIATAGEHLMGLIADLADLEIEEAEEFGTAREAIDLEDVARRAAGILGMQAREHGITIDAPRDGGRVLAAGEIRRVLQILLNLLGNALRYSPPGSQVWVRVERLEDRARISISDQGEGLNAEEQARLFEKGERLGRSGDGGSGLGLYISRRLARAMGGDLGIESAPGQGARFLLDLPLYDDRGGLRR